MLIVRWNEDKEGRLLASWYDDDRVEHGHFSEAVAHMDDYIVMKNGRPEMDVLDPDEEFELEPCFALGGCR